jgi:hypothetical protein
MLTAMYRKKLKIFIYSAIALSIAIYTFGFRKTILVNNGLNDLREKAGILRSSDTLKGELVARLQLLDNQLGNIQVLENDQEYILRTIHGNRDIINVKIIEVPGTSVEKQDDLSRRTFGATLEGNFCDLLKAAQKFEMSGQNGELVSMKFYRFTDSKTKMSSTRLQLFMQELNLQ